MSVLKVTKDNFKEEVLNSDKPVLLDFWATGCTPCKMISPVVEEIAQEISDAKIGKVNVDEEPELADTFKIMTIPTLVVIKEGKVVNKINGVKSKAAIIEMISG
ncbi:MAG: thioredoxin [Clostridiales bacterium]|jgi:thioredoxin 1|nr:thioredoxin [Clostridiales bacterium]